MMRCSRRLKSGLNLPRQRGLDVRRAYVLVACLALVALFVQASHPALHPHEVIDPDAKTHLTCPVSHTAGDVPLVLPPPAPACLVLWLIIDPLSWLGHLDFDHSLAPRPPPALPL
jgi:hypothetical protein